MNRWSIAITSLLIVVSALTPLTLYGLIYYQYVTLVLDTSNWIEISAGVIFLESIWIGVLVFFVTQKNEEKSRFEKQYTTHSKDLADVFREWQKSAWDLTGNYLFPYACEHLKSGYNDLWSIWFSEEKGKEGYKALSAKCDEQKEKIRKQIENKIRNEIGIQFEYTFTDNEMNTLVRDIYDYIENKVSTGKELFYFVAKPGKIIASIISLTKETEAPYRDVRYLQKSFNIEDTKETEKVMDYLEKIAEILNLMLIDASLNDSMKSLELYRTNRSEKLKRFKEELDVIINTSKYGFKGIEGKCQICRSWKP